MCRQPRRWIAVAVACMLALAGCMQMPARWTTYRGDAQRTGVDPTSTGSTPLTSAWTSSALAGAIYGQPLVYGGLVIVATESDDVYALDQSTGKVVWHASAGTPVDAARLPCGNIRPTVGITSTPVIDPATGRVFVVADTWDGNSTASIQHRLHAFNVADGSPVAGFPEAVDPPGSAPAAQLQRAALALDGNEIVIGFGGNYGDCGTYHGWLVAASESGGPLTTFEVEPSANGGAIWGSGDGPAVDATGNIWVVTGNGFGSTYGWQESLLKLDANLGLLDHWAPSDWSQLDAGDSDFGSGQPRLLPDGTVFVIGKQGTGALLSDANLGGTGGTPLFSQHVCGPYSDASFGGAVYSAGLIYVACADGLRALALDRTAHTFAPAPGWQVTPVAIGPPVIAGGLVWVTDWSAGTLYGLDPRTGQVRASQPTPPMEHFSAPAAANGKLFLATGTTVQAYTVAFPIYVAGTSVSVSLGASTFTVGQSTRVTLAIRSLRTGMRPARDGALATVVGRLPAGLAVASRARVGRQCGSLRVGAVVGARTITVSGRPAVSAPRLHGLTHDQGDVGRPGEG